eukprot:GHVR01018410.1.p1 GENE.GHVR01018410.1~~GHVR01018410.1.p1  ORF type:complete len:180 (+),score=74.16 GHVR01018410.1:72-611(+)
MHPHPERLREDEDMHRDEYEQQSDASESRGGVETSILPQNVGAQIGGGIVGSGVVGFGGLTQDADMDAHTHLPLILKQKGLEGLIPNTHTHTPLTQDESAWLVELLGRLDPCHLFALSSLKPDYMGIADDSTFEMDADGLGVPLMRALVEASQIIARSFYANDEGIQQLLLQRPAPPEM